MYSISIVVTCGKLFQCNETRTIYFFSVGCEIENMLEYTVGENIMGVPKIQNNWLVFQYGDSNIGLLLFVRLVFLFFIAFLGVSFLCVLF